MDSSRCVLGQGRDAHAGDFLTNSYAINISNGSEVLIFNEGVGFAIDLTDNSYAVKN